MADFEYSDDPELRKLANQVREDPDDFEAWNKLVPHASSQEGGLNRNSSPAAITATRDTYDAFLRRFPLFFGYWSKYADLEFSIAGPEAAEMVYERGIASVASVDLWSKYCGFKVETCHDNDVIRELFERAVEVVGLDYQAHPLWDKYIEFEERIDAQDNVFAILRRLIHIPLHQYTRYYERFYNMAVKRPIAELESPEKIAELTAELKREAGREEIEEREVREKLNAYFGVLYQGVHNEVQARWTYESSAKRPYYLVTELEEDQLENWRKYLDYEEQQGDFKRIKMLYERCLVPAAHYEEFWFRYVRWLLSLGRIEEARNVYQRASALFVPISCPAIRLHYAFFEESQGHADTAILIHEAILDKIPHSLEAIMSLVNTYRRQEGVDVAIDTIKKYLDQADCPGTIKGALASEWARLLLKVKGSVDEARQVYASHRETFIHASDAVLFWTKWLDFELQQATPTPDEAKSAKIVRSVIDDILHQSRLPLPVIEGLASKYLEYLQERGGADSMKEFLELDKELNGTMSVSNLRKIRSPYDARPPVVNGGQPPIQTLEAYSAPIVPRPAGAVGGAAPDKPFTPHPHIGPIPAHGGHVSHTQTSVRWQSR